MKNGSKSGDKSFTIGPSGRVTVVKGSEAEAVLRELANALKKSPAGLTIQLEGCDPIRLLSQEDLDGFRDLIAEGDKEYRQAEKDLAAGKFRAYDLKSFDAEFGTD